MKRNIILFVVSMFLSLFAAAQTVGLHLVSKHFPQESWHNNTNHGMYVMFDNGFTVGAYRNTLSRTSVYAGYTTQVLGPASITTGLISGYQRKQTGNGGEYRGVSRGAITFMLAPSITLPTIYRVTPRVSFIPGIGNSASALHLSIETKL